jgi:hypothetical protein
MVRAADYENGRTKVETAGRMAVMRAKEFFSSMNRWVSGGAPNG